MSQYFKDVNTLEELRSQYKDLLKKFHPDNANGSTEIVGCWIWVDGNTYSYKDAFKEIGFKWTSICISMIIISLSQINPFQTKEKMLQTA